MQSAIEQLISMGIPPSEAQKYARESMCDVEKALDLYLAVGTRLFKSFLNGEIFFYFYFFSLFLGSFFNFCLFWCIPFSLVFQFLAIPFLLTF